MKNKPFWEDLAPAQLKLPARSKSDQWENFASSEKQPARLFQASDGILQQQRRSLDQTIGISEEILQAGTSCLFCRSKQHQALLGFKRAAHFTNEACLKSSAD